MLRPALESERTALVGYLSREPEFNIFILGDIQNSGLHTEDCDLYVQDHGAQIEAVLLRYRNSLVPYTHETGSDLTTLAAQVNTLLGHEGRWYLSGKSEVLQAIRPQLARPAHHEKTQQFSVCHTLRTEVPLEALPRVRQAGPSDARELGELWDQVFGLEPRSRLRQDLTSGGMGATLIRDSGRLVSGAAQVTVTDRSAMILGVATHPAHRRKGYASACVYRLTRMLQNEGRSACLFFDNPEAGAIYHRLGFEDLGTWAWMEFR